MHRFYLSKDHFSGDYVIAREQELLHQLAKVLRAKEGEKVVVFCGDGREYVCQLTELGKKQAKLLIIDERQGLKEPDRFMALYPSLLKADKFEWLLQKITELGVGRIIPVISEHCIVREITPAKFRRYQEIIKEATEQCGGSRIPELALPVDFKKAIEIVEKEEGKKYIAWEKHEMPGSALPWQDGGLSPVHLFIGPEGGYGEAEIGFAESHGVEPISLGKRILRAETAGIFAAARMI